MNKNLYPTRLAEKHAAEIRKLDLKCSWQVRREILRYAYRTIRAVQSWEDRHGVSYVVHLADYTYYPYQMIPCKKDVRAIRNNAPYVHERW